MWPDRVLIPIPLTYESGALPTALCSPAEGPVHKSLQRTNENDLRILMELIEKKMDS